MKTLYFFGNLPFDHMPQRAQYLAVGLSERTNLVYIDPHRSFVHQRTSSDSVFRDTPGQFRHFIPPPALPFARSLSPVHAWNCRRTGAAFRVWAAQNTFDPPDAIVATFPDQLLLARGWPGTPLVYDVMDEPDLFLRPWQRRRHLAWHRELLQRADVTVTSSTVLQNRYQPLAREVVYVGNGVRAGLVEEIDHAKTDPLLAGLPRPRLGYLGTISHWFDFDATIALARAYPAGRVILVGPTHGRMPSLPNNVILTGAVARERIPGLLKGFDLGLIPFRPGPAVNAVNPVKLYEYASAGLPIVASAFTEMQSFGDLVSLYTNPTEAVAAVGSALSSSARLRESLRAFARDHTWPLKAEAYWQAIRQTLFRDALSPVANRANVN